ncbi:MAG: hypothetical protein EBE86_011850 [Hormoscilla sp. GUM202]|nr:hypothetical protein [Hormoscilla sp. GM7CHS1pb]MBO1348035.1 hypothetical protein [Hormoscilla sp. GUM202]
MAPAIAWGFVCKCNLDGNWQIIPKTPIEEWKLKLVDSRIPHGSASHWLLLIRDRPQVSFLPEEAQAFLSSRVSKFKKSLLAQHH